METSAWVDLYKQESTSVVNNLSNEELVSFIDIILEAHDRESIVFACGNGGNVAYVGNLVVDLNMHPFVSEDKGARVAKRNKFHCVNLCDCVATITGISNASVISNSFLHEGFNLSITSKIFGVNR